MNKDDDKMDIAKLANLARLSFEDKENQSMEKDLANIKKLIDRVREPDVSSDPMPYEVLRPFAELSKKNQELIDSSNQGQDVSKPSLDTKISEKLAPQFSLGHFVIPKVLPK